MRPSVRLLLIALAILAPAFGASPQQSLPLFFFPNYGLADRAFEYLVETQQLSAAFSKERVAFRVAGANFEMRFVQPRPSVSIEGWGDLPAKINFLLGNQPAAWKTGVPASQSVVYR